MQTAYQIAVLIHLLSVLGCFGILIAARWGLPAEARAEAANQIALLRRATGLIALGLLAGFATYYTRIMGAKADGVDLESSFHGVIGAKFLLLFAVGACLGIGLSKVRKGSGADAAPFTLAATLLLAVAAYLGVTL